MRMQIEKRWADTLLRMGLITQAAEEFRELEGKQRENGLRRCAAAQFDKIRAADIDAYLSFCREYRVPPDHRKLRALILVHARTGYVSTCKSILSRLEQYRVYYPQTMFVQPIRERLARGQLFEVESLLKISRKFFGHKSRISRREKQLLQDVAFVFAKRGCYVKAKEYYAEAGMEMPAELLPVCASMALRIARTEALKVTQKARNIDSYSVMKDRLTDAGLTYAAMGKEPPKKRVRALVGLFVEMGDQKLSEQASSLIGETLSGDELLTIARACVRRDWPIPARNAFEAAAEHGKKATSRDVEWLIENCSTRGPENFMEICRIRYSETVALNRMVRYAVSKGLLEYLRFAYARLQKPIPKHLLRACVQAQLKSPSRTVTDLEAAKNAFFELHS